MRRSVAKVLSVTVVAVVGAVALGGLVFAHAPSITITSVNGQDATSGTVSLSVATLPTTVDIAGTVAHSSPGNVTAVGLQLADNGTVFFSDNSYFSGAGNTGTAPFTVPWEITSAGNHEIVATVTHGNDDGTDTVTVAVTLEVNVTRCPAAPAIAADYMKRELGIRSGSLTFVSILTAVAFETGRNGDLWAANACDSGYADAVKAFVDHLHQP